MYMYPTYIMKIKLFLNGSFPVYPAFRASSLVYLNFQVDRDHRRVRKHQQLPASVYPPKTIGVNICRRSRCDFVLPVQEYFYMAKQCCAFLVLFHFRRLLPASGGIQRKTSLREMPIVDCPPKRSTI